VLNKERYGYLIEPMSGRTTLHDSQMKFQHIKLEFIGKKKKKSTWCSFREILSVV
jgi:hypothetical protein